MHRSQVFRMGAIASAVVLVAGCGGDGGDAAASPGGSLSGTSFKGPTAGATICAYQIDNAAAGKKGAKVQAQAGSTASVSNGCVVTANDGTYTFVLPAGTTSDLILESTGGTYCSDESVFNGTSCAGGGTPIAMGSNALRTVATPGAGGKVDAPLTLLTTAAANNASSGTLNASNFNTAYGTVATNFGLSNKSPSASPDTTTELKTALANLAGYVGGDTSGLSTIVANVAGGTLKANSGTISTTETTPIHCEAFDTSAPSDLAYNYMGATGNPPVPTPYSYPLSEFSGCVNTADGNHSYVYYDLNYGNLVKGGAPVTGTYYESRYSGGCSNGNTNAAVFSDSQYLGGGQTSMTMQWVDNAALPLSATTDPSKSQSGTVSRLTVVLQGGNGNSLGLASTTTYHHLACRTARASYVGTTARFLLTSTSSPVVNGSLSRLEPNGVFTGYSD